MKKSKAKTMESPRLTMPEVVATARHRQFSSSNKRHPPFFWNGLSDGAVFRYYATLIDTVADARLRLYLYHFPQLSGVPISPQTVAQMVAAYPGIIAGVKDSSGDFGHTADLLECAPGLSILVGHEPHIPMSLRSGGAGTISGLANLQPREVAALLKPESDPAGVARILTFLDIVLRYPFVPAFKAIHAAQTGDIAWRRVHPPLLLDEAECSALLAAIDRAVNVPTEWAGPEQ